MSSNDQDGPEIEAGLRKAPSRTTALEAMRRHALPAAVVIALFTGLAIGYAIVKPPTYTAEFRLAVGAGELSSTAIPGFPTASEDLAASYARWVTTVGAGTFQVPPGTVVRASPIAATNVIRIEADSKDEDVALETVAGLASALKKEVNAGRKANDPDLILDKVVEASQEGIAASTSLADAQSVFDRAVAARGPDSAQAEEARIALREAQADVTRIETEKTALTGLYQRLIASATDEADLRTIGQGAVSLGNDQNKSIQRFAIIGFCLGVFAALLLSRRLERPRRRR